MDRDKRNLIKSTAMKAAGDEVENGKFEEQRWSCCGC